MTSTTDRIHERAEELRAGGIEAAGFIADLTDRAQAETLVDAAVERFGRIDILVNNAGMVNVGLPIRLDRGHDPERRERRRGRLEGDDLIERAADVLLRESSSGRDRRDADRRRPSDRVAVDGSR